MELDNLKLWMGVALGVIIVLLSTNKCNNTIIETTTETIVDTVTTTHIDTVALYDTIVETKVEYIEVPIKVERNDSVFNRYTLDISDTLIEGQITTEVLRDTGLITFQKLQYKPLFPKYIHRVDTIRINTETTITKIKEPKALLSAGLHMAIMGGVGIGPSVNFTTKKQYTFNYNYDLINQHHSFGVLLPIRLKNGK